MNREYLDWLTGLISSYWGLRSLQVALPDVVFSKVNLSIPVYSKNPMTNTDRKKVHIRMMRMANSLHFRWCAMAQTLYTWWLGNLGKLGESSISMESDKYYDYMARMYSMFII